MASIRTPKVIWDMLASWVTNGLTALMTREEAETLASLTPMLEIPAKENITWLT